MNGPASHRRLRLGGVLRDARIKRGLSQDAAGKAVGRSQGWITKIESASIKGITHADLEALLTLYGIEGEKADELRSFARAPYDERGVWVDTNNGPSWWTERVEIEATARVINVANVQAHDVLLQSEPYMRRQFELAGLRDVDTRVAARLGRQQVVLDQATPPDCTFVLDEACLHKNMGDPDMMAAQIEHLLALSERPNITILVQPFDARFPASTYGFTLMRFGSPSIRDFVGIEYEFGAATIDDDATVLAYQQRWELVRSAALSDHDTRQFLRRVLATTRKKDK